MARWTPADISAAQQLREMGLTSTEIGLRIGRHPGAVRRALTRNGASQARDAYLSQFNADPIEHCHESKRLRRNAIVGSARLRDALLGLCA